MAGLAASAPPLAAGSSPLRLRNPAPVCCLTRPQLLKVAKPQPCILRRSAPASRRKITASSSSGRQGIRTSQYQFDDDESLWLAVVREFAAGLSSLVAFLADQPRQLKHLEWPGFQNMLRTATLTLILVAVFIVALSSVDAALSYILSWLLRKSA